MWIGPALTLVTEFTDPWVPSNTMQLFSGIPDIQFPLFNQIGPSSWNKKLKALKVERRISHLLETGSFLYLNWMSRLTIFLVIPRFQGVTIYNSHCALFCITVSG
jgi:hypothetical protein